MNKGNKDALDSDNAKIVHLYRETYATRRDNVSRIWDTLKYTTSIFSALISALAALVIGYFRYNSYITQNRVTIWIQILILVVAFGLLVISSLSFFNFRREYSRIIEATATIKKIEINGKSYSVKPEIKAPAGENDLKIYYTALSFIAPNKIRFKYKLDGFDYHWKDCKNIRIADYPKLPFRDYHFRVIACNSDGIWNSVGTSISLKLTPKFYQTFIFKILLLCLGIFFLFWFIFFTGKEIKRSKIFSKNKCKKLIFDPEETEKYVQKLLYLVEIENSYEELKWLPTY